MLADIDDRRGRAAGGDAGAEERLLLRARPRHRRVPLPAAMDAPVNWATGDGSGKPVGPSRSARGAVMNSTGVPFVSAPGAGGAHSWHPMAIPSRRRAGLYPRRSSPPSPISPEANWEPDRARGFNTGLDSRAGHARRSRRARRRMAATTGALIAWDPVTQFGTLAGGLSRPVERRPAGHRRAAWCSRACASGNMAAFMPPMAPKLWRYPPRRPAWSPRRSPMNWTGCNMSRSWPAGAGSGTLAPGGILNEISGPLPNISAACWCSGWAAPRTCPPAPPLAAAPDRSARADRQPEAGSGGQLQSTPAIAAAATAMPRWQACSPDLRHSATLAAAGVASSRARRRSAHTAWWALQRQPTPRSEAMRQYVIHRANEDQALGGRGS